MRTRRKDAMEQSVPIREAKRILRGSSAEAMTSMECSHQGRALYKHASLGKGWLCGCGRYVPDLPDGYAVVFMAFPLQKS